MQFTSSAFAIARPPRSFFLLSSGFRSVRVVLRVRDFPVACQAFACQDDEEELRVSTLDLGGLLLAPCSEAADALGSTHAFL